MGSFKEHESGGGTVGFHNAAGGGRLRSFGRYKHYGFITVRTIYATCKAAAPVSCNRRLIFGLLKCRTTVLPVVGSRCASKRPSAVLMTSPGQRMSYCREHSSGRCAATHYFRSSDLQTGHDSLASASCLMHPSFMAKGACIKQARL